MCWLLLGLVLGLFAAKFRFNVPTSWLLAVPALMPLLLKKRPATVLVTLLIGLLIGGWRGSTYFAQVSKYNVYYGKSVTVRGTVLDDMSYDEHKQSEFHVGNVTVNGHKLPGRIRIRALGGGSVGRGDVVLTKGRLNKTLGTSRQGGMSYVTVQTLSRNTSWVEKIRGKFFASIYSSLPEPHASLGLGFLVGVRTALPDTFNDQLAIVGLTHIVAVSGYNLTIIVQAVRRLFAKRSAYQSVIFSVLLIFGFLMMTGWSPSIMRAAIVTGFSLLAWYYGRQFKPLLLILLGAAITGYISPLYVWGDAGWYLSFLAFTGVLIVAPLVSSFLFKSKKPNLLVALLIETLAAQLLTFPYIAMLFGRISLIAPIANLLVVPFIPLIMLLVFLTGLAGIFFPVLALWMALVPRALLSMNIWVVERLSTLPKAQINLKVGLGDVAIAYATIGAATLALWLLYRRNYAVKQVEQIDWNLV